jgi:hypothetical protein
VGAVDGIALVYAKAGIVGLVDDGVRGTGNQLYLVSLDKIKGHIGENDGFSSFEQQKTTHVCENEGECCDCTS